MEKVLWIWILFVVGFVGFIFYGIATTDHDAQLVRDLKYSACVESMTEAIPDPNETEERAEFLKNCYEN